MLQLNKNCSDYIWDNLNILIDNLNHSLDFLDKADNSVYTGLSGISLTYLKLYEITRDKGQS